MLSAAVAALPFKIPVAHIHGGESTEGVIDEAIRHSITKMRHIHFASTKAHAVRIRQMGEEPWRITVSGAPSLDNLYHPVTLAYENTEYQVNELLAALKASNLPLIFTFPHADTSGRKTAGYPPSKGGRRSTG